MMRRTFTGKTFTRWQWYCIDRLKSTDVKDVPLIAKLKNVCTAFQVTLFLPWWLIYSRYKIFPVENSPSAFGYPSVAEVSFIFSFIWATARRESDVEMLLPMVI